MEPVVKLHGAVTLLGWGIYSLTDDADALIAHGRFLQEKFGHASSGGTLNLGDQPPPPPPNSLDLP